MYHQLNPKMKKICLILLLVNISIASSAQWSATNLTQSNILTITGATSHNGELLAIVFNGIGADLYQLDPGNTSWTQKSVPGVNEIPQALVSAGSQLYMTSIGLGYGMVYRSDDNGLTYSLDTVGLPKFFNGISSPIGIDYFNGKVLLNLGGAGYWLKDAGVTLWEHIDPPTSLNGGGDPICFSNDSLYAHDNSGANIFYVSGDYGQTWSERNTDLPAFFEGDLLVANKSSGRLYMAGSKDDGTQYGIYISDDHGHTWSIADLSAFIGTDVLGGQQEVSALYADGGEIYVALENDQANTTPDVLSSENGISTLSYDTLGLLTDPAGTIEGSRILRHGNSIALVLNVRDVYLGDAGSTSSIIGNHDYSGSVSIYPNPVDDLVRIMADFEIGSIELQNAQGKTLIMSEGHYIDVSDLPQGMYILKVIDKHRQSVISKRILKN